MNSPEPKRKLQSLLHMIHEQINNMKTFDTVNEINARYFDLECELELAVDSAIKKLQTSGKMIVDEMRKHRDEALRFNGEVFSDSATSGSALCGISNELKNDVNNLDAEATALETKCSTLLAADEDYSTTSARDSIDSYTTRASEMIKKANSVLNNIRKDAFKGRFPVFRFNLRVQRDLAGRFGFFNQKCEVYNFRIHSQLRNLENPLKTKHCVFAKYLRTDELLLISSEGSYSLVNKIEDDSIISFEFDSEFIRVVQGSIKTVAELPCGRFMLGDSKGFIHLSQHKSDHQYVHLHTAEIIDIRVIDNRKVATMSFDNTIKIMDSLYDYGIQITGHGCIKLRCQMGLLSNGCIVTCSNDTGMCMIRVWDPETGELVQEKQSGLKQVCALAVLSNDLIVLASADGSMQLVSLFQGILDTIFMSPNAAIQERFIEVLPNDDIIIAEPLAQLNLQIWNPLNGQLVQTFETGHTMAIKSCFLCAKKEKLVTASQDNTVRIFQLNFAVRHQYGADFQSVSHLNTQF